MIVPSSQVPRLVPYERSRALAYVADWDFESLQEVEDRLLAFQDRYEGAAKPFESKFTREDLRKLLAKLSTEPKSSATDTELNFSSLHDFRRST